MINRQQIDFLKQDLSLEQLIKMNQYLDDENYAQAIRELKYYSIEDIMLNLYTMHDLAGNLITTVRKLSKKTITNKLRDIENNQLSSINERKIIKAIEHKNDFLKETITNPTKNESN